MGRPCDAVFQRRAVEELHHDEGPAVFLANVVDGADVGMIERRGRPGLTPETLKSQRIVGQIIGQELQRHKAAQARVFGLIDDAHTAAAEPFQDAVVRDRSVDHLGAVTGK